MTKRLEDAIKNLTPEQLEKLATFAEQLAPQSGATDAGTAHKLQLNWAGRLADAFPEYTSGVEAAHAAARLWRESVERSLAQ